MHRNYNRHSSLDFDSSIDVLITSGFQGGWTGTWPGWASNRRPFAGRQDPDTWTRSPSSQCSCRFEYGSTGWLRRNRRRCTRLFDCNLQTFSKNSENYYRFAASKVLAAIGLNTLLEVGQVAGQNVRDEGFLQLLLALLISLPVGP